MASDRRLDRSGASQRVSGLANKALVPLMMPGAVFRLTVERTVFPESRLPTAGPPTIHHGRRVVLVAPRFTLHTATIKTLLVVPCSASETELRPYDLRIPDGEPGFDRTGVIAYASLLQPLLKGDLGDCTGQLTGGTLADLFACVRRHLDLPL